MTLSAKTIFNERKHPLAVATVVVTGARFLHGEHELALRGFTMAIEEGAWVRAMRDGDTFVIEDKGHEWWLRRVVLHGPRGLMVDTEVEALRINKEGGAA
jgi:hypothetical protein